MLKLTGKIKITGPYTGSTKFDFWKNLQPDDILEISLKFQSVGSYINTFKVVNMRDGSSFRDTQNSLFNYFEKTKHEEV
jgi:hypothetical protein